MTRFAVTRSIGKGVFDYNVTLRTNSTIIDSFIGVMIRAKIGKEDIVRLCYDIFNPIWRKGIEKVVHSIDDKFRIQLPKKYMGLPLGATDLETTHRRQSLIIRESLDFYKEWSHMEASVHFLLR